MAIVQGYMGTTDPAGLDALIEDCQATGYPRRSGARGGLRRRRRQRHVTRQSG